MRGRNPPFLSLLVSSSFSPPPRQTEEMFVYFFTDTLFVHSFLAYGTTPPYHSRLKSQFLFSGEGEALESTILAYRKIRYSKQTRFISFLLFILLLL